MVTWRKARQLCGPAVFVLTLAFLAALPVWAAPVRLDCAASLSGDVKEGVYSCLGGAQVSDATMKAAGDTLHYDANAATIVMEGDVRLEYDGMTITGSSLTYHVPSAEGSMTEVLMSQTPEGAKAPVYIQGEKLEACPSSVVLLGARLTTCDPNAPGYYLAAQRIEIFPEDKVVVHHVRFVESGLTLFYWPRLQFSLRTDGREIGDQVRLPRVGHSEREGWFVKFTFPYSGPGRQYGDLLVDYMTRLGLGLGLRHTLRNDDAAKAQFSMYAQPNKVTEQTDTQLALDAEAKLPAGWSGEVNASHARTSLGGEQEQLDFSLALNQSRSGGSSALSYRGQWLQGVRKGFEHEGRLSHSQRFAHGWQWQLGGEVMLRKRSGVSDKNLIGYQTTLRRDAGTYSLYLKAENAFNPELAKDEAVPVQWNSVVRLPEIGAEWRWPDPPGWLPGLTWSAGYGRFAERQVVGGAAQAFRAERWEGAVQVRQVRLGLGPLGELRWGGSATRRFYSVGKQQWIAKAQASYTLPITAKLQLSGDYNYVDVIGDVSPFRFDRVSEDERVQGRLAYVTPGLNLSVSSGYDLRTTRLLDAVGRITLQPGFGLRLQGQTAFSLESRQWKYAIATLEFERQNFGVSVGAKYSFPQKSLDRADARLTWDLGKWKISYSAIYDGLKREFERGDLVLTQDLGCRVIDLRYSQTRGEIWVEYRIPAFPMVDVKVGADESKMLFDLPDWQSILTEVGT